MKVIFYSFVHRFIFTTGISLLQQSNSDAMETLKNAIPHTEGPVPGHITLTIARRASSPGANRNKSNENLLNCSSSTESQEKSDSIENSGASSGSSNTVIFNPQCEKNLKDSRPSQLSPMHTWNPVVERLTGKQQMRNESYYKVKHTFK